MTCIAGESRAHRLGRRSWDLEHLHSTGFVVSAARSQGAADFGLDPRELRERFSFLDAIAPAPH